MKRIFLYFQQSMFGCLFNCCLNEKSKTQIEIIEHGAEKMEETLDIKNIIENYKAMRYEFDMIKRQAGLEGDPIFSEQNAANSIDFKAL